MYAQTETHTSQHYDQDDDKSQCCSYRHDYDPERKAIDLNLVHFWQDTGGRLEEGRRKGGEGRGGEGRKGGEGGEGRKGGEERRGGREGGGKKERQL